MVVSGSGLPVFAAVAQLLKLGVPPNRITVVVREVEGTIEGISEKNVSGRVAKLIMLCILRFFIVIILYFRLLIL